MSRLRIRSCGRCPELKPLTALVPGLVIDGSDQHHYAIPPSPLALEHCHRGIRQLEATEHYYAYHTRYTSGVVRRACAMPQEDTRRKRPEIGGL